MATISDARGSELARSSTITSETTHPMFGCYTDTSRFSTSGLNLLSSPCCSRARSGTSARQLKSKNAYLYVDPPSRSGHVTLYHVSLRQCVLSFTDANQTRLGEASFIDCRTSRSPQAAPA
jgi:hypothetical protein